MRDRGRLAGGRPCLLELETDTRGEWHRMRGDKSDQLYRGSGDKSLRAKSRCKVLIIYCWLHLPAARSAFKCKIGPNSGLMHLQPAPPGL